MRIPRKTVTTLLLLMVGMSAIQATGSFTFVSADTTITVQLTRSVLSTDLTSGTGTIIIDVNTGQLTIQLNNANPNATYAATFLNTSASSPLQLGALTTASAGRGNLTSNLSSGKYVGIFQLTRVNLVQYASVATSFTVDIGQSAQQTQNTITSNGTGQVTFQVEPTSNVVNAGGFAKFGAYVVDSSSAEVSLVARGVPPTSIAIFTPETGVASPTFNSSLTIVTSANTPQTEYSITLVAIVNGTEFTKQVGLQVLAPSSVSISSNVTSSSTMNATLDQTLSMSVNTDQSQYQPGSTVKIEGQVTDATGDALAGATVGIQVDTSMGTELLYTNNIQTDSAGTFRTQVTLGTNATTGTYTVFASASKFGYSGVTSRTTFVVGISTTPSVIIKAVYAGDSSGNPTSTFKSGQTIWIWVVIENVGATFQGVVWIQVRDPNGVPIQIQIHIAQLAAGQTIKDGLGFSLPNNAAPGVYTVNALVSDKLISQGGIFLASSETQFALTG